VRNKYFRRTHISESIFRKVLRHFSLDITALVTSKLLGICKATIQRIYTLLRERVQALALEEMRPLAGVIEVDESYFGARWVRGKRGRGASGKTPVLGLHVARRSGLCECRRQLLQERTDADSQGALLEKSDVYTDGWKAYDGLVTNGYQHHRVYHHENEFVRGKNHVNGIESFWSFA
jgi:transposase